MTSPASSATPLLPWWEEWSGRLEFEVDAFSVRGLPVEVVEDPRAGARRLVLATTLRIEDRHVRLTVVYPDSFPFRRFRIESDDLDLGRHQAPGGDLCVLGRAAKFWRPAYTGAEIVAEQVPLLVDLVARGGADLRSVEDQQGEPFSVYYPYSNRGAVLLDERFVSFRPDAGETGRFTLTTNDLPHWMDEAGDTETVGEFHTGQGWITAVDDEGGQPRVPALSRVPGDGSATSVPGRWVRLAGMPDEMTPLGLWNAVHASLPPAEQTWVEAHAGRVALAFCADEEVQQDIFEPAWVFLVRKNPPSSQPRRRKDGAHRSGDPSKQVKRSAGPQVFRGLRVDERSMGIRIPASMGMRSKDVAVLGLGSLGAPIVQELAKARVGQLRLLDGDFMDPATSVRHPLGHRFAGVQKAIALAKWVHDHDAGIAVHAQVHVVGTPAGGPDQLSDREVMHRFLDGTDLVVGATAEMDVNRYLDHCAIAYGVPRLYAWSQSGYGGLVALLREGTGCFHCLELLLRDKAAAGHPLVAVPPEVDGATTVEIQGIGCADKTFTAPHTDLLPISIQAARVAHDFLTGPSSTQVPGEQPYAVWVVQVRDVDGTAILPIWRSHHLPVDARCRTCGRT